VNGRITNSTFERIIWDDPAVKWSHPNKLLKSHLEEVELIFQRFANFYGIEKWAIDLMLPVIRYHDLGKLNSKWKIRNDNIRNPPHSEYSIRYLKDMDLINSLKMRYKNVLPIILYFILKHHSSLYDRTNSKDEELQYLCTEIIRDIVSTTGLNRRIEMADSFGIFKLADSLSASNIVDFQLRKPPITIDLIRGVLRSKFHSIDQIRWNEQQDMINFPNISLLTAYTGWGKTDSSLLFCMRENTKKIFYLFPMITAINKFHDKLNMFLNGSVEKYFYLYEYELATKAGESVDETNEFGLSSFIASHFLKPMILTTVDQFLLTFLQLGKYYMKRVMFRDASVIVDEVHLINLKMLALLFHFINKFASIYNLRILFMSATFSEALIQLIKDKISTEVKVSDLSQGYKRLLRVNYDLNEGSIIDEDFSKIEGYLKVGKKYKKKLLVVVNTVETAIQLYRKLEFELKNRRDYSLLLLHGKFMYRDRKQKEDQIDDLKDRPHILVATQVCEVSLDVSYDTMLTEMAPIPSLIQRFGRVNRYGSRTDTKNVQIYKEYRKNKSYDQYPYELSDMITAKKVLKEIKPITSEYDLIKAYNDVENYTTLSSKMDDVEKEIDFDALWERDDQRTGYFFSFKWNEEQATRNLLQFRESLTANVLPDPTCVSDIDIKAELTNILTTWQGRTTLSGSFINFILKKMRGYFVPMPIWLVTKHIDMNARGLPIVKLDKLIYSSDYGFIERRLLT
jgi:CRISPR-associated endonuclease/helicase Cas3